MHVDDYDVPFAIVVFEFQFPLIVDHTPFLDFDVVAANFETSHDAIDYDFLFGDFSAIFRLLEDNESKLNNVSKIS